MEVYTARQAILNRDSNVAGYELFFRDSEENVFPSSVDGHEATSKLIGRTYFNKGVTAFTDGKRALLNFPEKSLLTRLPFLLPKDEVIIEILETVTPSDAVFKICNELFEAGYVLALDDFVYKPEWKRFLHIVRVIKFDLQKTPLNTIIPLIDVLKNKTSIKLLAEKVETHKEHQEALKLGFDLFQGYYFLKPEMQVCQDIESPQLLLLSLFQAINKPEIDQDFIINLLQKDCNLVFKLLSYVNSGIFPIKGKISSVKQAITYMGESQLKSLISLFVTAVLSQNKPPELLTISAVRAKFCELIIKKLEPATQESAFMTGMLSLIDAVIDIPMNEVTARLALDEHICETLLDTKDTSQTNISMTLRLIKYLEQGSWYLAEREAFKLRISINDVNKYYQKAIQWSEHLEGSNSIKIK